jgi:hypothetical protein
MTTRAWWTAEAARHGTDLPALVEDLAAVAGMAACPTCGGQPCLNPNFCAACRKADRKTHPREHVRDVRTPAPSTVIEALVYSCRQGPSALDRPDNLRRLASLDREQLREVYARVQRFESSLQYEGRPAERWSREQADALLDRWNRTHG